MKVYIDITNLIQVQYLTGIQRVVQEVVLRMLNRTDIQPVLLCYENCGFTNHGEILFREVDHTAFRSVFAEGNKDRTGLLTDRLNGIETMQSGDVFYDIDSVWSIPLKRSILLPKLKDQGVRLAVFMHDVLPITHPQYCADNTLVHYMNYVGAYLQAADLIITSTKSTFDETEKLLDQLGLPKIRNVVSGLGSDFVGSKEGSPNPEAKAAATAGKYILSVGTIEPRKNHKLLLDAFDQGLKEMGYNLILVGKTGWNVEQLQERILSHPDYGKHLFHLKGLSDYSVDYLYRNAYLFAFPTFAEGFGIPLVEAMQRGTPVLASDIPVLREIGGSYAEYFDPQNPESFLEKIRIWDENLDKYKKNKENLKTFQPQTWDNVAEAMCKGLLEI